MWGLLVNHDHQNLEFIAMGDVNLPSLIHVMFLSVTENA